MWFDCVGWIKTEVGCCNVLLAVLSCFGLVV